MSQATIDGQKPFKSRNKKVIKSNGMKFIEPSAETPEAILLDLEEIHGRTKFYAMSSGGKDSQTLSNWLDEQGKLEAVLHIQTNVGLQITTDFVKDYCQSRGWKLYVVEPNPQFIYAAHVLQYGFPQKRFHRLIMGRLKYKTMRDFALTIDRKNHCLISGVRKFESKERKANYPYPIQTDGSMWFGCPYFYKTDEEIYKEFLTKDLPISPAYKLGFHASGECLCGSFAKFGDKQKIKELDSKLAEYIEWLEDGIQRFGTNHARRYPTWGGKPKMSDIGEQEQIDEFFKDNPDLLDVNESETFICGQECGAGTMRGETDF